MLDRNVIDQLSQLKKDIVASKDLAEGTVTGTSGRYGFVKLDDGRNAFLNPEKMQRVLPGDRVKVNVIKNDKDQLEAEFETFIECPLHRFVGYYKVKNGTHFIAPEDPQFNRWLFVPPPLRLKCQEDDYVLAELARHPYEDGKAAVKPITRIGADGDDFIHHNLVIARFGIHRHWSKDAQNQVKDVTGKARQIEGDDLNHLPFVTIDSANTRDMDDAVYVESSDAGGWQLWVAIANPGAYILPGSPIAKSAKFYGQSVYLPGRGLSMLPEPLATDTFSLVAGEERPALVCRVRINEHGELGERAFLRAKVTSRNKLNYQAVSDYLDTSAGLDECDAPVRDSLVALDRLASARSHYRQTHCLVFDEQLDYEWQLDKRGLIEAITPRERTRAHRLIEEAMVTVNICAGEYLAQHGTGVYTTHLGFRPERLGEVRAVLREEFGSERDFSDIDTFDGYIALIKELQASAHHAHLLPPLKRMMQSSELSPQCQPHMGLGFKAYATVTSPIRRYADLSNHWSLLKILQTQKAQPIPEPVMEQLRQAISSSRQANRQLEQTLWAHYLQDRIGLEGQAQIRIVTQQGFGVRLVDSGIEGFVQFSKKTEKNFDAKRMTLQVGEHTYAIDQQVKVKVIGVDLAKRRVKMQVANTEASAPTRGDDTAAANSSTAEL